VANAVPWTDTDTQMLEREEQTGLDTLVVPDCDTMSTWEDDVLEVSWTLRS
jgi:hypothetical protein